MSFFLCERKREWTVELVYLSGESQNSWGGKWSLTVIRFTSPAQAGPPRASFPGLCPNSFLIPLRMETFTSSGQPVRVCFIFHSHVKSKTCRWLWREIQLYQWLKQYCYIYRKHLYIRQAILASASGQVGVHLWYCICTSMSFKGS